MNKLKDLVKTATGYKEDRGDVVSLVNLKFSELPEDTIPEKQENPFFGLNLNKLAELSITALVVLIGLLTVVKPFISSLMRTTSSRSLSGNSEISSDNSTKIHADGQSNTNRSTGSKQAQTPINIDHIEGMVNQSPTKKIAELVDRHPEEAVSIIRSWIHSDK